MQTPGSPPSEEPSVDTPVFHKPTTEPPVKGRPREPSAESRASQPPSEREKPPGDGAVKKFVYVEPSWSGLPPAECHLDVLKNGVIIDTIDLTKSSKLIFGRMTDCDVLLEHPSVSRHHAVLQYCATPSFGLSPGWHIYDFGSSHGTALNKRRLSHSIYAPIHTSHVIKLAASSRLYIMQDSSEMPEPERDFPQKSAVESVTAKTSPKEGVVGEEAGVSWGIQLDDEVVYTADLAASAANTLPPLQLKDPKKTLRGFYEREGLEMPEYLCDEVAAGKHRCQLTLPVSDYQGAAVIADVTVSASKKEAVLQCAVEACHILDRHGVLRQEAASRRRQVRRFEDDFYASDEDEYLDRTGQLQEKRDLRRAAQGENVCEKVHTEESIKRDLAEVEREMTELEGTLAASAQLPAQSQLDSLENYMSSLRAGGMDATSRMKLRHRLMVLKKERLSLERVRQVLDPTTQPPQSALSSVGKRRKATYIPLVSKLPRLSDSSGEEEEEVPGSPSTATAGLSTAAILIQRAQTLRENSGAQHDNSGGEQVAGRSERSEGALFSFKSPANLTARVILDEDD